MTIIATILLAALVCLFARGVTRWWCLTALCTMAGTTVGLGVSFPQWQMFGKSICRVSTSKKIVALTFDDGPDPVNTPALLELLKQRAIRATFFCIGKKVVQHPALVKQMVAAGHDIENHTFAHSPLTNLFPVRQLENDLLQAQNKIQETTGSLPKYFRPPVGMTNPRIFRAAKKLDLRVTGYSARGLDRRPDLPEKIARRLLRKLQPGAIFLLHDAGVPRERLLAVVTLLLDNLASQGYQCLRLDELTNINEH